MNRSPDLDALAIAQNYQCLQTLIRFHAVPVFAKGGVLLHGTFSVALGVADREPICASDRVFFRKWKPNGADLNWVPAINCIIPRTDYVLEALAGDRELSGYERRFAKRTFGKTHRLNGTSASWSLQEDIDFYAMQIAVHEDHIEVDVDPANPTGNSGLWAKLKHLGQVLHHGLTGAKTDPFDVLAGLRKRGLSVPDLRTARA